MASRLSQRRPLRLVLFTHGNLTRERRGDIPSLPAAGASEDLSGRSDALFEAIAAQAHIVAWGNGRLVERPHNLQQRLAHAERCRQFLLDLRARGVVWDAIVQQDAHPCVVHDSPYFILSDGGHRGLLDRPMPDGELTSEAEGHCFRGSTGLLAMSDFAVRSALDVRGCAPERVHKVGMGVLGHVEASFEKPGGPPMLLWVGTDWARKGGPEVVEAFAHVRQQFPDAELVFAGSASAPEGKGIRSYPFLGETPEDQATLDGLFRRADLFVLPSHREPLGLVYLEAMARKTPVVGTTIGGIEDIVREAGCGVALPPKDPRALARTVCELLSDMPRLRELGRAGYRYAVEECRWPVVAGRMLDIVENSVVNTHATASA